MPRFCVVKFCEENSVTVVPSSWVTGEDYNKVCAWPPYKSINRLTIAVKNCEPAQLSWQSIKVVVMKFTDTYEKGLFYEEQAMYTSDFGTDEEVTSRKSTKKRKLSERNSSSEDETSMLPPMPQIKRKQHPQPQQSASVSLSQPLSPLQTSHLQPLSPLQASHLQPLSPLQTSHLQPLSALQTSHLQPLSALQTSQPLCPAPTSQPQPLCTPQTSQSNHYNREESFQRKVFRMLESIKQEIKEIKDSLGNARNPLPQIPSGCPKLPCASPEDLMDLNNILKDDLMFGSICDYLSTIGGGSVKDVTRRILAQLISSSLSQKYNWKGTRGLKLAFSVLTYVMKLIFGAVRNNPSCERATEVEVAGIIKNWLMHAKDREGGRNKRNNINAAIDE